MGGHLVIRAGTSEAMRMGALNIWILSASRCCSIVLLGPAAIIWRFLCDACPYLLRCNYVIGVFGG
jgi:hypothetical protein